MTLPKIKLTMDLPNPNCTDARKNFYIETTLEWEVLTLHLEKGTMRVRTEFNGEKHVYNIDSSEFFKHYAIESL